MTIVTCIYRTVKILSLAVKNFWRIRTVGSLAEKTLKSICIENVMEIVKIGDKLGETL